MTLENRNLELADARSLSDPCKLPYRNYKCGAEQEKEFLVSISLFYSLCAALLRMDISI